ncbi:MAG: YibE/F family protein, partial [Finegoldia magna]|nr:YibE/F family protein [Finegoldia magna]
IMIFILHGTNTFNRVVSSDFFAVEITKALIGISVVIIMVPVTSFFASKIYSENIFNEHIK